VNSNSYSEFKFEKAVAGRHTFAIMKLYQENHRITGKNEIFYDVTLLEQQLNHPSQAWLVMSQLNEIVGFMQVLYDAPQSLAKLATLCTNSNPESNSFLENTTHLLQGFITNQVLFEIQTLEVMYITTTSLTLPQMQSAHPLGFHPVGAFPGCITQDVFKINGIAAYYKSGVLESQRYHRFSLHSAAQPLFEVVKDYLPLESTLSLREPLGSDPVAQVHRPLRCPDLEFINAPHFVKNLFEVTKQNSPSLTSSFYPFHIPNVLICDPKQQVNVFVLFNKEDKFATIIGEKFLNNFDLKDVYLKVTEMLYKLGAQFIELVNDAADREAIESAYFSGFVPCCYFPGLKKVGNSRRDTIVQARSFERPFWVSGNLFPGFQKFANCFESLHKEWVRLDPLLGDEALNKGVKIT